MKTDTDSKPIDFKSHLDAVNRLIADNEAQTDARTPHLDQALNGLRLAAEQIPAHCKAVERAVNEAKKSLADRKAALAKEEAELNNTAAPKLSDPKTKTA